MPAPPRCRACTPTRSDLDARGDALYGAWLCGTVLGAVAMGLHHKLCHTLGGSFNLPHAEVHTVVLPHALAYNAAQAPEAMARIARALRQRATPAHGACFDLAARHGAPDVAARHRHAGRRSGPRRRPRRAEPVPQPAAARTRARCARCCSAPSTVKRPAPDDTQDHKETSMSLNRRTFVQGVAAAAALERIAAGVWPPTRSRSATSRRRPGRWRPSARPTSGSSTR